jgi:thiosulfate dehydrogenase
MVRNKTLFILLGALVLLMVACSSKTSPAPQAPPEQPAAPSETEAPVEEAEEPQQPTVELFGDSLRGGLLYDKWWTVLGVDNPEGDQPLWATQDTNKRSGADTWRCKECHGWDYKGADGAYDYTGFPGVMQLAGADPNEILTALKGGTNPDHDFSTVMDEQALIDLALFISQELVDDALFTNADKTPVSSDVALGEDLFQENCADCHGPEGLARNFHTTVSDPEFIGGLSSGNPWEFMHKVRFGQPGTDMMSTVDSGWTTDEMAAVLAYAQTLPEVPLVSSGGLLYDKWWEALGVDKPTVDQPLWATQDTNTRSGADTWRCKECHGWDYKGAEGVYGSGSHFTGFPGILASTTKSADELRDWFDGTANADHDFSEYLDETAINMLVAFIQEGLVDTTPFINEDKTVNGDPVAGEVLYEECAECHGDDGKLINFGDEDEAEFVGTIANDNPWEFLHKAANGQPGTHMLSGRNMGWSWQDLVDLLAFAQSLPTK